MNMYKKTLWNRNKNIIITLIISILLIGLFSLFDYQVFAKKVLIDKNKIEEAIELGSNWLINQQKSDGSWPIVTKDSNSSLVATGLYGLKTIEEIFNLEWENEDFSELLQDKKLKAINFLLSQQNARGYWESVSSIPWNRIEASATSLIGLVTAGYQGDEIEKGMDWLIDQQEKNGSWSNDCWDTIWVTYLLLENGYSFDNPIVQKSCNWLVEDQKEKGYWKTSLSHLKGFGALWTTQPALFTLTKTGHYQESISKGLEYLKKKQNRSGSFGHWDASKTGMALYVFASLDQYPELKDEYQKCADKAVKWFLRKQRSKGTWPGGFHPFDIVDTSFALWGLTKYLSN